MVQIEAHQRSPSFRIHHAIRPEAMFRVDREGLPRKAGRISSPKDEYQALGTTRTSFLDMNFNGKL